MNVIVICMLLLCAPLYAQFSLSLNAKTDSYKTSSNSILTLNKDFSIEVASDKNAVFCTQLKLNAEREILFDNPRLHCISGTMQLGEHKGFVYQFGGDKFMIFDDIIIFKEEFYKFPAGSRVLIEKNRLIFLNEKKQKAIPKASFLTYREMNLDVQKTVGKYTFVSKKGNPLIMGNITSISIGENCTYFGIGLVSGKIIEDRLYIWGDYICDLVGNVCVLDIIDQTIENNGVTYSY